MPLSGVRIFSFHGRPLPTRRLSPGIAIACATWLASSPVGAQDSRPTSAVIDTVRIVRENVFDRAENPNWLTRSANRLHVVTRQRIVARELLVQEGAPWDSAKAAESARNLRRLGIFRDVTVDSARSGDSLAARVTTHDSWTTQVTTSFKAGGDQITWSVGLAEKNFLGSNIKASLKYTEDPDRSSTRFGVGLPRVWRDRLNIVASYDELSDGKRSRLVANAPFLTLTTRRSAGLDVQYNDGDVLRFYEGEPEARDTLRQLLTKGILSGGWAPRASAEGYLRILGTLQVRREDYTPTQISPEDRSFFGELELGAETSRARYAVIRGYRNLGGPEDIDLSRTLRVGLWFASSSFGYERSGIGPAITAQVGRPLARGFATAKLRATSLFTREGLDSGSVALEGVYALQPGPRHSVVVGAVAGMQKDPRPGAEYDLGLSFGPRGFPAHGFTGDRAFFTSAEYRWLASSDLWGLAAIGLATFVDYGGAWYAGSDPRTGTDAGIGLRIGSTRASSGKGATRVDITRRFANDVMPSEWVIAVGAGFPFERTR